jgi:hypothetical protein
MTGSEAKVHLNSTASWQLTVRLSHNAATGSPLTAINGLPTLAPNLALSRHILVQNMISSTLQDDKVLKDDDIAKIADCSDRAVRRIRSNVLLVGSTKAPSSGAGRPKTITPPMLTALYNQLAVDSIYPSAYAPD